MIYLKAKKVGFQQLTDLVGTPVPQTGEGRAEDDPGPGEVRGHGVTEHVEGVVTWCPTLADDVTGLCGVGDDVIGEGGDDVMRCGGVV